jgi:hypothetical protein
MAIATPVNHFISECPVNKDVFNQKECVLSKVNVAAF